MKGDGWLKRENAGMIRPRWRPRKSTGRRPGRRRHPPPPPRPRRTPKGKHHGRDRNRNPNRKHHRDPQRSLDRVVGRRGTSLPPGRGRRVHRRPHRPRRGPIRRSRRPHHRRFAAVRHAGAHQRPLAPAHRAVEQGGARGPRGPRDVRHRALRTLLRLHARRARPPGRDGDGLRRAAPVRSHHRGGPLEPDRGVARPRRPERASGLHRLVLRRRVLEDRAPARARLRLGRGARPARVRRLHPDHGPRRAAPERAPAGDRLPGPDRDLHRVDPPRRGRPRPRDRPPPHHPSLAVEARVPRDRAPPREDPA